MKKLTTKKQVKEFIKDILALEIGARDEYLADSKLFKDSRIVSKLLEIEKDEEKHILLLNRIIGILEK